MDKSNGYQNEDIIQTVGGIDMLPSITPNKLYTIYEEFDIRCNNP